MIDINKKFIMDENSLYERPKAYTHKWECFEKLRMYRKLRMVFELEERVDEQLEYRIIKIFKNLDLWYEPVTDGRDGCVLRDNEGYIISSYG